MSPTLLVFAPHPDDAEFFAGGTIARLVQEGWKTILITLTDGRCGSLVHDSDTLAALRAAEARQAALILGAEPPVLLGYPDQGLDLLPPGTLREQCTRLIRQYRPEAVIAEDILAVEEVHPDHRATARAVAEALNAAALPLVYPEHLQTGLQPHFVIEKYFYGGPSETQNKLVDISATLPVKLRAMSAHRTQVEFLVTEILNQAKLADLDAGALLGPAAADPTAALAWALQAEAAETGARAGVPYAEAFRYVRFHPILENLLSTLPEKP